MSIIFRQLASKTYRRMENASNTLNNEVLEVDTSRLK